MKLQTAELQLPEPCVLDYCTLCHGVFFDPQELQQVIAAADKIAAANSALSAILAPGENKTEQVQYIKCPVCRQQMQRRNFGGQSGVIIDLCSAHGTWLDPGELGRLIKWSSSGGSLDNCKLDKERERLKAELELLRRTRFKSSQMEDIDF